ncbi:MULTISPECIES: enoyl-CoA hydratase/isomerase family protein [Gordonia]|uniref:enoyl-CoA hydratase/isomerase family protein n=1 Tax=Gordonia TaxID=2053 RepID=UPI00095A2296|nr:MULTISPECIES: enoyl-CoA hydratase/isomerase family protein [Gordonia]MDH3005853.1 enoyl-CoA hydratase/isomerase family protein [Gordonia alkanivorans]MDH3016146.1 enoyl-CoA hydratase/isomerase family protein [Gordonia alkanivorans]MDH3040986.1 enoyl-CoA hydratase/isomerase family protein [Gordonia alkanivorans]OLT46197.1 enoyl-CoA hydratase [Gordonia sp. CNJ-863]
MQTRRISVADLAAFPAIGGGDLLGDRAAITSPVVLVDLDTATDAPAENLARAAARAAASDVILVGIASGPVDDALDPLLDALDLTYATAGTRHRGVVAADDVDAAISAFTAAVELCPQASLVAAQVVRTAEPLDPVPAIDVESLGYSTLQGGDEFGRWLEERRANGRPLPPPAVDPVLLDRDGNTLRITLNRPERRNAYGTALRDAFVEALRLAVLDDSVEHVVVDGAGSAFCAGGDLDEFGHMPDASTAHLIRTRGGAGRLVAVLADRVEVRLHGPCVGAGIEIPAFAGRVVAAPDTRIRLPEVSMGLIPGAGGTVSVPRRIGRWRALHLFVTGVEIDAAQALDWGLVDDVGA